MTTLTLFDAHCRASSDIEETLQFVARNIALPYEVLKMNEHVLRRRVRQRNTLAHAIRMRLHRELRESEKR